MGTRIEQTDLARDALYTKVNQIADEKQDVISDLSTIRSGAALGATAVQLADLATVATTGAYSDLSGTPTVDQTYNASSTNAQSGVAVASAISGKADDNAVVHIAGTETITGNKTFTGSLTVPAQTLVTKQSNNADEGGELQFEVGTNSVLQTNVRLDVYENRIRIFGADSNNIIHDVFAADLEENRCRVATQATSSNDDSVATTAFVKSIGYLGLPSTRIDNLTIGASGATYTAPADGWVCLYPVFNGTGWCSITNNMQLNADTYGTTKECAGAMTYQEMCLPVNKGDVFVILYGNVGSWGYTRFIYAKDGN